MGIQDFSITTNHPNFEYRPGQQVRGKVHFGLDSPKKVRGVYAKLEGVAKVKWTAKTRTGRRTRHTTYGGEYEYFNERIYFLGQKNGDTFELVPKDYDFEFQYRLPDRLPSSYQGTFGSIQYTIKVVLDIPLGFDDEEEVWLVISSPVNLNTTPYLAKPEHRTEETFLWCCCCQSGPLRMEVNLPKTGFITGEDVPVNIDVENQTSSKVHYVGCTFEEIVTYHSETPEHNVKDENRILCSKQFEGVEANSTKTFNDILSIPAKETLNFDNCRLLEVSHHVKVICGISGLHRNFIVKIPITLGSTQIVIGKHSDLPTFAMSGIGTPYPHPYPHETEQDASGSKSEDMK